MAEVTNWIIKCKEQKKVKGGKVLMRCILTSKDKDGNYYDPMWLSVFIGKDTTWKKADYSDTYIEVSGKFFHSDSEFKGKKYKDFTIWADTVNPYDFDKKKASKKASKKAKEEDEYMDLPEEDEDWS